MGLFDKLFGKSVKSASTDTESVQQEQAPCKTEQELIERYSGIALDKQMDFGEIIGNNHWQVDIQQGVISFGQGLTFPIQVLGTISRSSRC